MALLLPLLPILAQIGPYTPAGASPVSNIPRVEGRDVPKRKSYPAPQLPPPLTPRGRSCQDMLENQPDEAIGMAQEWVAVAKAEEMAEAEGCLGMAQARRGNFEEAETALLAARDAAGDDKAARAAWGTMAGNAAIAGGQPARALAALSQAHDDALPGADKAALGAIALDKARALVGLYRAYEARIALDEAAQLIPAESDVWLLSATLYRRTGKLEKAQADIERAVAITNGDPAIGLEAGVIAMLAGREEAAKKSWQSVVLTAPSSPEAATAKDYLAQIGSGPLQAPPGRN